MNPTEAELTVLKWQRGQTEYQPHAVRWAKIIRITPKRVYLANMETFNRETGRPTRNMNGMGMFSYKITNYR